MWTKDRANRARWARDQKDAARANFVAQQEQERLEQIAQLRHTIETAEEMASPLAQKIAASARIKLERLI